MMQVKKFEANEMKTALQMVKRELGPDAVILSSREIKDPGGLSSIYEVTAAADDPPMATRRTNGNGNGNGTAGTDAASSQQQHFGRLSSQLGQIKEMLENLTHRSKLSEKIRDKKNLVGLYRHLLDTEIDPAIARGLVEQVALELPEDGNPKPFLIKKLKAILKTSDPLKAGKNSDAPRILLLVGPCGSGKTTTLAKLAARVSKKKDRKVALISMDSYRLGATEQLKAYARIMGLPFKAAQDNDELSQAIDLFDDMDLILVDTAGRSFSDDTRRLELAQSISALDDAAVLLVLSAAYKDSRLDDALQKCRDLPVKGLVVTMLDETSPYGNIINSLIKFKIPVSYLSNGQKVPDDLITATPNRLAALVTGGSKKQKHEDLAA